MEGKKGFVLYTNKKFLLEALTDEQAGILFKHIYNYVNDKYTNENEDDIPDAVIKMAWLSFKADLKEDLAKWKNICERNRENGLKGGRPKQNPKNPLGNLETQKTQDNPEKPKKADIDIDIESDIEIDKEDISNDISLLNYSIDSPEIKKNQSKNPSYNIIFDTWNAEKPLIHHHELTPIREKAMDKALKNFQTNQIVDAIKHYAMVLRSHYKFTYKWDLETFLKQENAMPRFTDEGGIWNSFLEAVNENPLILALEDRTEDVPTETPDCIKDFMDKIK